MDSKLHQAGLIIALALSCHAATAQTHQQWRDSLDVINRKIATTPYSSDLHLRKAAVNLELEQWSYAVDEYSLILRMEPSNLAALFFRAYANEQLRRLNLSRDDYEAFLKIAPFHFEARLALALVNEKMGRKTEAFDQLNRLVEMFPDSANAYAARADYEHSQQMMETAELDWKEAVRLKPDDTSFALSLVNLLLEQGKKQEARRHLDLISHKTGRAALREWYEKVE